MIKRFINFILSFFRKKSYDDALSGYVAPSSAVAGAPKPAIQRKIYEIPCQLCHEGMPITNGQIVFTHKECRKGYRRKLRSRYA